MKRILIASSMLFVLAGCCLGGCSSGGEECDNPVAFLNMTTRPNDATAEANGNDDIRITVTGQDETCANIAEDATVEFSLRSRDPADVGQFSNGEDTIAVPYGKFGAEARVVSNRIGTARVRAFVGGEYNLSEEVAITFEEPSVGDQCAVNITAVPTMIPPDGESESVITATLVSDDGGDMPNGTAVTFTTTRGEFAETHDQNYEAESLGSRATATLVSELTTGPVDADVNVTFTCDDGQLHSNSEKVIFGEANQPMVDLRTSTNSIPADDTTSALLTATVFLIGGDPAPAGIAVSFVSTTSLGRFQGGTGHSFDGTTDDDGVATAVFIGGSVGGIATIRATAYVQDQNVFNEVDINIRALGNVKWVSSSPDKLGVKGSGKDESSTIIFELLDTADQPFPAGAQVTFNHSMAPGVVLDPLIGRTDVNGQVKTTLNSGTVATTVTVTATAQIGTQPLSATCPSIAIVGAKPNARYLTFACDLLNVGAYNLVFVETGCTISLADRYSNKIGFSTNVTFRTEAGSITASALTEDSGNDMGMASVTVRTGNPEPADVPPWPPNPPWPSEPFIGNNNPRDGLVTIIAATTGEEEFTDTNGNGVYDLGEPFVDMPEPFIDVNDNGLRDPTELFLDSNSNQIYDDINGVWDSDTLIWTQTWMLWTGDAVEGGDCGDIYTYSKVCPDTFYINKGSSLTFTWQVKDHHLNPVNESLRVDADVDGKGSLGGSTPPLSYNAPDTLGYFEDPIRFGGRGGGFGGEFIVNGAPITDMSPPAEGYVSIEANYKDTPGQGNTNIVTITVPGTFQ